MKPTSKHANKLTREQIEEIKDLLRDERKIKQDWIAKKYNVRQSTIAYHHRKMKKC